LGAAGAEQMAAITFDPFDQQTLSVAVTQE
jgi:hypothetical protein